MSDYIGDIASLTKTQSTTATKSSSDSLSLNMEDFLQMMVAQFQNQDPEDAASTTDMLNQMVQMSMIQAITNITDAVSLSYSASLVGKEVTVGSYDSDGKLKEIVGTVTGTGSYNGSPVVFVDGVSYNMSVSGTLFTILMTLLFFTANGQNTLLRILLSSGEIVPFGEAALGKGAMQSAVELFIECFVLAVKLAVPILAAELLGQIGMGVLMKVIPQINVFAINIELKMIIGLGLMLLFMSPISEFLLKAENEMLLAVRDTLTTLAP